MAVNKVGRGTVRRGTVAIWVCLASVAACGEDAPPVGGIGATADTGDSGKPGGLDAAEVMEEVADVAAELPAPQTIDAVAADVAYTPVPCQKSEECATLVCTAGPSGKECAQPCIAGCPADYECVQTTNGSDVISVCIHKTPYRCAGCSTDNDCDFGKAGKGVCAQVGAGKHCVQTCDGGKACVGTGFACVSAADGKQLCMPASNQCSCLDGQSGACSVVNAYGTCAGSYTCAGGKEGVCQGPAAAAESCNLKDDDCDGQTDEDVANLPCDLTNVYGTCKGKADCVGGKLLCQGQAAAAEVCNGIDDNCSGLTDEGFANTDGDAQADCVDSDDDADGILDAADNCPLVANPDQINTDKDALGDACDPDDDGDKVADGDDNCPLSANASQTDSDGDGKGDACDCDLDGDGVPNGGVDNLGLPCPATASADNCPLVANASQIDTDADGLGDACDGDKDGDGIADGKDNCPLFANPTQTDNDKDGLGDACDPDDDNDGVPDSADNCPNDANADQADLDKDGMGDVCDSDKDGDGVANAADNCPGLPNAEQKDENSNGIGDACENDWDSDGVANSADNCPWIANPQQADVDGDKTGDACDCDADGDGVANLAPGCPKVTPPDNCTLISNADQADLDGDGTGDACDSDKDGDGDPNASDCAPADKNISKNAKETCNSQDDNCDGKTDEEGAGGCQQWYFDGDKDGFGVTLVKCLCAAATPYTAPQTGDCNDKDAAVNPDAKELCGNGKDDNCNGSENDVGATGCVTFYADSDGDGVGVGAGQCQCQATSEFSAKQSGDCADNDAAMAPNQAEKCADGKDNDCNGQTDEENCGGCAVLFADSDGDGFGIDKDKKCLSKPMGAYTAVKAGDCDDSAAAVHPGVAEACNNIDDNCNGQTDEENASGCSQMYADLDGDGFGVGTAKCLCAANGAYTASQSGDCNDKDKAINPAATELCGNGKDDNCNGSENDENATGCLQFYSDADGDGYGVGAAKCFCSPSGNYTAKQAGDCNDADTAQNPGLSEKCSDGKDNNCNDKIDEPGCQGCSEFFKDADQDGYGVDNDKQCLGSAKYPYTAYVGGDCSDGNPNVKPGGAEVCNGLDDNCDGQTDPVSTTGCSNYYPDVDKDGFGANVSPVCYCKATGDWNVTKTGDCNDNDGSVNPSKTEVCNGVDDNCNNQIDENVLKTFYKDNDGDGYGSVTSQIACSAPTGYVAAAGDCNDFNKLIFPGATEVCNDVDDDCNGFVDDGLPLGSIYADLDGDGYGGSNAKTQKKCLIDGKAAPLGYALSHDDCDDSKSTVYPGAPELCDGILNNCNQAVPDAQCPKKCEGAWPVFVGGSSGFQAIAQLDGDNNLEVISRNEGHVRAFKASGAVMWDSSQPVSYSYPALGDFNNDATLDVVSPGHDGSVHILNGNTGAEMAKIAAGTGGYYGAAVFDVDRDGVPDIVPTGFSNYTLLLMNSDLTVKKAVALAPLAGENFSLASAGLFDLQGDGVPEIFLGSGNWTCSGNTVNCKGRLYAFDIAGGYVNDPNWADAGKPWFKVGGYPQAFAGEGVWPGYLDLDGDGVPEVHHHFSNSSSSLWAKDGSDHALSGKDGLGTFPMTAPVTASGAIDASGKLTPVGGPLVDIDNDGTFETVGNCSGGVCVFKNGKVMDGYPVKLGADALVAGDLNRDGQLDIVFTSGSNNSLNCYTLGADTYADARMLYPGTVHGLGRSAYPTLGYDPFEPNDIRTAPFDPAASTKPVYDSRAMRISALRDVYSSGGGWTHKLQAVIGDKGDRDYYYLGGSIAYVTLVPAQRDLDLYLHIYKGDGTFLATWKSTGAGTGSEAINCHSTTGCPAGASLFIIEVRGKDASKDYGPWPYWLYTNWAQ